tara:strand:+ start:7932 stop:8186 length:255 start_codon:yes stop_codon:yes gene_type:complete
MGLTKRVKRVFIDLEYCSERDLIITLERLKIDILNGVENRQSWNRVYQKTHLESNFKQWYPIKVNKYTEQKFGNKTIFKVESNI